MPSWQSIPLRWAAHLGSHLLFSRKSLAGWRSFSSMGAGWNAPRGRIDSQPARVSDIPVEWLIPKGSPDCPVILYFHGGGWVLGWHASHRRMTARIAEVCQSRLLAVDYRLAPEHPFPAALEDCLVVFQGLLKQGYQPGEIVLAGDSAGGNLVLTVMLALKQAGHPLPAAGICLSPVTDLVYREGDSRSNTKKEALFPIKFVDTCIEYYLGGQDPHLPLISPLYGDLTGLPPLLIQVGSEELLLEDAERFAGKARQSGIEVTFQAWERMWHVWQAFEPYLPEANQAIASIAEFFCSRVEMGVPSE